MPYPALDPRQLQVFPLSQRRNLLHAAELVEKARTVDPAAAAAVDAQVTRLAERIASAPSAGRPS